MDRKIIILFLSIVFLFWVVTKWILFIIPNPSDTQISFLTLSFIILLFLYNRNSLYAINEKKHNFKKIILNLSICLQIIFFLYDFTLNQFIIDGITIILFSSTLLSAILIK
jgi:hypothetical protein